MDAWDTPRPHHRSKMPSFSSSLLDAIYRSIDESNGIANEEPPLVVCTDTSIRKNRHNISSSRLLEEVPSLGRAIMIDKWMENRSNSSPCSTHYNSNSTSSDSSCGGVFSSSEAESTTKSMERAKQSRTCMFVRSEKVSQCEKTPKHHGRFMRTTKSRALKIYGDLKKVKQPISPGGRIASFLNSIFNSRTVKRTKLDEEAMEDLSPMRKSRSVKDSATLSSSTAASFSRSCLSTKSSGSEGLKRSVRFCPVSIIVDEDCRPCGQKSIYKDDPSLMRNLKNAQRERFRDYQVKRNSTWSRYEFREFQPPLNDDAEEEEVESCCSSDLFELENIGAYREELPVYGTTNLKTNYAIANGIIL